MDLLLRARTRLLAISLLAAAAGATADSLPPQYATDYRPYSFTQPAADGFWSQGEVSNRPMFTRFDADGRVVRAFPYFYGLQLTPLPDGGLLAARGCTAERLDAQGTQLWRSAPFPAYQYYCAATAADAAGNSWLYGVCSYGQECVGTAPSIVRLDSRGIVRASEHVYANQQPGALGPLLGARVGAGAWLATGDGFSHYGADGNSTGGWYAGASVPVTRLAVDANDRAWGFAPRLADGAAAARVSYALVDHDGRLVRTATVATVDRPDVVDATADATGAVALIGDVTITVGDFGEPVYTFAALRVHRFDAQGMQSWTRDLVPNATCYFCTALLVPGGDAVVAFAQPGDPSQPVTRLVRYAPDGSVRSQLDLPGTLSPLRAMPDGSVMALLYQLDGSRRFVRYSAQGQELPTVPLADVTDGQPELLVSRFERSGIATTLAIDVPEPRLLVTGYGADGNIAWRRETPERVVMSIAPYWRARMSGNGRRTCWSAFERLSNEGHYGVLAVECMDATSGAVRFRRTVTELALLDNTELVVLGDDTVLVAFLTTGRHVQIAELAPDGTVRAQRGYDGFVNVHAFNSRGDAVIGDLTGQTLAVIGRDGTRRWTTSVGDDESSTAVSIADDGAVAYLATPRPFTSLPRRRLVLVTPDGTEQWRSPSEAYGPGAATGFVAADPVLAELRATLTGEERRVTRFSAATGAVRWAWLGPEGYAEQLRLDIDVATQSVAVATASAERARITLLDATDGTPRIDRVEGCASADCDVPNVAIDERGGVRFAETGEYEYERPGGPRWRLRALPAPADAPRIDQGGLGGAWYPEYAAGQGLFLEWLPVSRVAFGTWFTFTAAGGNSPAALRWYSLQGQLPDAPRRATLTIYENRSGNFAAPPVTGATPVGAAQLTLDSCDRATLAYQFTSGELTGTSGQYSLVRLTRPRGCVDAGGAATPAPPASGGFDAAQSGAWFTPSTSGQGLDFSIEPGGTLFAAWFTYDPAGNADDDAQQHWFTLQGSLVGATDGRVTVPIYSTIGGAFDRTATHNSFRVGEATVTFTACDRATLAYRFDAVETVGAYTGRSGTLALERLGGCAR